LRPILIKGARSNGDAKGNERKSRCHQRQKPENTSRLARDMAAKREMKQAGGRLGLIITGGAGGCPFYFP